jgi:stage II sporulation protein D
MKRILKIPIGRRMIQAVVFSALSLSALALCLVRCGETPFFREETLYPQIKQPAVTVKLLHTNDWVSINSNGSFAIRCFRDGVDPSVYYSAAEISVGMAEGGLTLSQGTEGQVEAGLKQVVFFPGQELSYLHLNGIPYRGALEITPAENARSLLVLNVVHLEDYIRGVVAAEMGKSSWQEMEALKAQAVAARTYSLDRAGRSANEGYDLEATVADQVYSGIRAENPLASRAVELTQGEVLTYQAKLIFAYYHANSGGKTEYIEKVWDKPRQDYLIPIEDGSFCSWSENYTWVETWTKETLERNLTKFLSPSVPNRNAEPINLANFCIRKRSASGRVEVLDVVTDWGTYPICGDRIRWALRRGSNSNSIAPSTWFDLEIIRDSSGSIQQVIARGRGNGHGVGMCQTGAIGMARKGYSYEDILRYYYPGTEIRERYGRIRPRV